MLGSAVHPGDKDVLDCGRKGGGGIEGKIRKENNEVRQGGELGEPNIHVYSIV